MKLTRNLAIMAVIIVIVIVVVIAAVVLMSGPTGNGGNTTPSETNPISIVNFAFSPNELTIHVRGNVTWTNNANIAHTVTSDSSSLESFSSGTLSPGQTFTHQFNQIGNYSYHCSIHTSMTGIIHVIA